MKLQNIRTRRKVAVNSWVRKERPAGEEENVLEKKIQRWWRQFYILGVYSFHFSTL